jgi:hypothetical protein
MNVRHLLLGLAISFAAPHATSFGEITLNIDPGTTSLWFSGNDTGTPTPIPAFTSWTFGSGPGSDEGLGVSLAFSLPNPDFFNTAELEILNSGDPDSPTGLRLFMWLSNDATTTISTDELQVIDYSLFLSANATTYLSNLGAGSMTLSQGTGWSSITIAPVPEPATLVILGVAGSAAALSGFRKLRSSRTRRHRDAASETA